MLFLQACSGNLSNEVFYNRKEYDEWRKEHGGTGFFKLLDPELRPAMKKHEFTVDKSFMRIKKKDSDKTVSVPIVKIYIDGNKTSISKLFSRFW